MIKYPVEYLIFKIENFEFVDLFVELDNKIWTSYLKEKKGFISKEVFIDYDNKHEVHTILIWENLECWKDISKEELIEKDQEFQKEFNHEFKIIRRIHEETNHGLFKVLETIK